MKNKLTSITIFFCCMMYGFSAHSQDNETTKKLLYTIQVDGLVNRDQVKHLDDALKQKSGIISDEINFELKTVVVKTTAGITYANLCDVLLAEKLKAQNYIVKEE